MSCVGADLGAVLSEAQLAAVHEVLAAHDTTSSSQEAVRITQQHMLRALGGVRPSVPHAEKARLERLYARFKDERATGVGSRYTNTGLRATQA